MKKATKLMMMDHMGNRQSESMPLRERGEYQHGYHHGYPRGYSHEPEYEYGNRGMMRSGYDYPYEDDDYAGGARMVQAGGTFWMQPQHTQQHMQSREVQPLTESTAMQWMQKLQNADGSTGAHWRAEQTEQYRQSICPECKKWEFFAAMNMLYSDYCDVMNRLGVSKPEAYAHMAKAFLMDADAADHKIEKYMTYIAK